MKPRSRSPLAPGFALAAALWLLLAVVGAPADAQYAPRFEAQKTPKGLSFYYLESRTTPFAAINFAMRDVYALTTPGKEAFNAFGTSLVMQGADGAGQTEFTERLNDLTASASITFGPFATLGNVRAPPATIAASMSLMASALKGATPSEKLLARLRQRASSAEAQGATRAETIAQRTAMRFALGDHPFTRGYDPERFERISVEDLSAWRNAVLSRDRLRIAASGRISKAEAGRIIDDAFADLPTLPLPPLFDWPKVEIGGAKIVVENDTPQSAILMVGLTSILQAREMETANVANSILGGSGGRLWQGVRASIGSTYGASSSFQLVGPGKRVIAMRAAVANDQVEASIEAVRKAYSSWRSEGVTAAEIKAATSRLVTEFRSSLDEPSRANGLVIGMLLGGRVVDEMYGYENRLGALTTETAGKFIAEKFPPIDSFVTVIVTPRASGLGAACVIRAAEEVERCRK